MSIHVCYVTIQIKITNWAPPKSPRSYPIGWTVLYVVPRFATAKTGVRGWRWPHGFLHVTTSFGGKKGKEIHVSLLFKTNHLYNFYIKEQVSHKEHLLDWIIFMARLCHHSFYFILLGSIGFSQIGSLCNRQLFDTHIRNTFKPTQPKTTPLIQSCKEQHYTSWACMRAAAYTKQIWTEDGLGSPYAMTWCLCAWEPTRKEHSWALKP